MKPSSDSRSAPADAPTRDRLSKVVVALFAVTAGASAGCLYYLQPLLHDVATDLGVSTSSAGLIVSVTQIGYLIGLALIVPLADFVNRRLLVTTLLVVSCVVLAVSAAAPDYAVVMILMFAVGISASAAQIVVPWAAAAAGPSERGAVVGTVMGGLLIGILASRVLSGLISEVGGWRTVLVVASVAQVLMAVAVAIRAPRTAATVPNTSYPQALRSVLALIREHNVLRHRMLLGGLNMAAFSAMWTAIAFLLAGAHGSDYRFSDAEIGLFGLAGIAGALAAPRVGRLADRGLLRHTQFAVWSTLIAGWVLLWLGAQNVLVLVVALLVFDFGVQGVQIANQTAVYSLDEQARSRLTTAYMVAYFARGVLGSAYGAWAYQTGGWTLLCVSGIISAAVGLAYWAWCAHAERSHPTQGVEAQAALRAAS